MRFLRSLRGGSGEASDSGSGPPTGRADGADGAVGNAAPVADGDGPGPATEAPTDEARAAELIQEFEAGLSDLARRQVRYSGYAWEPPAQLDRRGRWILTEAAEGTTGHDGRRVALRAGDVLELDEPGEERADRTTWRFVGVKDGRALDLPAGPAGSWPDGLERPRSRAEG